jgi:hypothetical protein
VGFSFVPRELSVAYSKMADNPWESDEALKASLRGGRIVSPDAAIGQRGTWVDALHASTKSPRLSGMKTNYQTMRALVLSSDQSLTSLDRLGNKS